MQIRRIAATPAKKYSIPTDVFFSTTVAIFSTAGIFSKCARALSNCFFIISTAGVCDIVDRGEEGDDDKFIYLFFLLNNTMQSIMQLCMNAMIQKKHVVKLNFYFLFIIIIS